MKVGSNIGRLIKINQATILISRGKFARICVEVDITKPLLAKFNIRRRIIRIEYEVLHLICFQCGTPGHHKEQCPSTKVVGEHDTPPEKEGTEDGENQIGKVTHPAEFKDKFGTWMMVSHHIRKAEKG